jgi:4-hydroxybenzoate polyprenyltransferase
MIFAFVVTFLREVTKDVEDMRGDMQYGLRTLPLLVGIRSTQVILSFGYLFFALCLLAPPVVQYALFGQILGWYLVWTLPTVMLPGAWLWWQTIHARRPSEFAGPARGLKWLIVTGFVAVLLIPY